MKVLIISNVYYPTVSPRAIRWSHIAEQWARNGHDVDVITSGKPGLAVMEQVNGVAVHRAGSAMSEQWKERFKESANSLSLGGAGNAAGNSIQGGSNPRKWCVALLSWIRRLTWKKLWWPDSSCLWYFPARKKAAVLCARRSYDALVTVSLPFTGHLIGLYVKKRFAACRWVADSGDPFCFLDKPDANNRRLYDKKNYSYEKKIFREADAVTVTTAETSQRYAAIFPDYRSKLHVIPPLLALSKEREATNPFFPVNKAIRLVYVGRLYRDNRNPDFLLELFQEILAHKFDGKLELHILGSVNDCADIVDAYKLKYNNNLYLYGSVAHRAALQAMTEADILVNIGNANSYQLPSKVVEYARTGKPIVNLAIHKKDSSASFFANYPLYLNLLRERNGITPGQIEALADFIEKRRTVPKDMLSDFLESFRADQVALRYETILSGRLLEVDNS
ncbi:MAG: glycosyltransferase [Candidatus Latescibacterota bacterium]